MKATCECCGRRQRTVAEKVMIRYYTKYGLVTFWSLLMGLAIGSAVSR